MSKIILLNGAGSSGKTSIARSIQHLSSESWLTFGIDTFIEMTPYPSLEKGGEYFSFVPGENAVDANPSNDAHKLKYKMNSNHLSKSV